RQERALPAGRAAAEAVVHERAEEVEAVGLVDQGGADDVADGRDQPRAEDRGGGGPADVADLAREVPGPLEAGVDLEAVDHAEQGGAPADAADRAEPAVARGREHGGDGGAGVRGEVA